MMKRNLALVAAVLTLGGQVFAGGPLVVGGPTSSIDGQPYTWNTATPIQYRVDPGPMSATVSNAAGLTRVQILFNHWHDVLTANISYVNAGPILATGAYTQGTDVRTATQFNAISASCDAGTQSPIVFDADGTLFDSLFGANSGVIGFAGPCSLEPSTGRIRTGFAALNGKYADGVSGFTAEQFDEAMTHEFGHFSGLDHSQINVDVFNQQPGNCDAETLAGLPLMFPIAFCQARSSVGLPIIPPDDAAWISKLYPGPAFNTNYGIISGLILFSDGNSQAQGVNVIARRVDDPNTATNESRTRAYSVVSGYVFTSNPGQPITGTNSGSSFGTRNPLKIGYYEIPVPPGTYTVQVESIFQAFDDGSSVGPLGPPVPNPGLAEFWTANQSPFNDPAARDTVTVAPGQTVNGINIILNGTPPRFDQFEDGGAELLRMPLLWITEEAARA
jgi:hypothetical protein